MARVLRLTLQIASGGRGDWGPGLGWIEMKMTGILSLIRSSTRFDAFNLAFYFFLSYSFGGQLDICYTLQLPTKETDST